MSLESLLDTLRCPVCVAKPEPDPGRLSLVADKWFVCQDCDRKYPICDQIPVLLAVEGSKHQHTRVEALDDPCDRF